MAPIVHGLEVKYFDKIGFVFLDIDDSRNTELMREFNFRSQPTFILIDGEGTPIKTWFGMVSADDFEAEFEKILP